MKICTICNSKKTQKIIKWDIYSIYKCNNCKLIFSTPLPDDKTLLNFYQGFLFKKPHNNEIKNQLNERKKELIKLFSLNTNLKNKNFLDYGGGTGSVYKAACELDLNAYYYDLDEKAKSFVKEQYGLTDEFIISNINDTNIRFDYIFSDNVIEHLKYPIKLIGELKNLLNDNGVMVIKTPHASNTESYFNPFITIIGYFLKSTKYNSLSKSIKSYLIRFWHCDPPRHIYAFSEQNLKLIALKSGFLENEIEILYYNLPLWEFSVIRFFFDLKKYSKLKFMFIRIICLPIIPIEIFSKILHFVLLKLKILTPGGIILRIKK